ncbi:MAG TPA: hypothetical protein VND45_04575 [Thermoanaerobaculia bacterium]|jgi:tetratricopeptide (TPR) repeat protein|nr:hypothetical protein [Thermoanaerobaculia bacterium]
MNRRLLCVAFAFAIVACRNEQKAVAPALAAPSEAEAQKFVDAYVDALRKPNVQRASQLIDWPALVERATTTEETFDQRFRRNFIAGAVRSDGSVAASIVKTLKDGGRIAPLRIRTVNGERRALVRLLLPDGSLNYHEMPLVRDSSGFIRARDIYVYATGEYLSDTLRRLYIIAVATNPNFLQRLSGKKNAFLEVAPRAKEMMEKVHAGDGEAALKIYNDMPPNIRRDKALMLAYVMATSKTGDDKLYAHALDELRAAYPNDRGMEMLFIDSHLLAGRHDEAMRSVDRVEEAVGGDPYLDTLRAGIRLQQGNLIEAERYAARACERDPKLEDGWWSRVNVTLKRKDFAETARLLRHLRDDLDVEVADLRDYPDYAEFVRSPEYREFTR